MENLTTGDTIKLTFDYSDYSAADYNLWVALRGPSSIDIKDGVSGVTITPSGSQFSVEITAATTANWTAGDYWYAVYCGKTLWSERYTAETGTVKILSNLSAVSTTYDNRTHAKKTLDAIEAVIEGRASIDQMMYMIAGRQLSRTPIADLLALRDYYRRQYVLEQQAEKIKRGESSGRNIMVRFG